MDTQFGKHSSRRSTFAPESATFLNIFITAMCAWTFVRLAGKVGKGSTDAFDNRILRALRHPENPAIPIGPKWLPDVVQDLTTLGGGTNLTVSTLVVIGSLLLNRRFRAAGFLVLSLGSGMLLSRFLKDFFVRPRPTAVPRLARFDPGSFPSGHSMLSALVYLTLGGIISRQTRKRAAKTYFLSVSIALSALVGFSRMYLGVHYPSDVIAGWAAGSLWSMICTNIARWLQHRGEVEPPAENPSMIAA